MEIKRGERGMTLLEVMIAMGVSMAMLAAGTALYINGIKQSVANQAQAMGSSQAQKLATTIENDIQQAVLIPTDPAHPTITVYTGKPYAPDATTLVLKLPAYKCVDNVGNTITCDASNANLNVRTLLSTYDYVVYQFVQFETVGGVQHKTYNIWKIVSADPASSRQNSSGWVFPYSASFDATDPNQFRSDPYVQTWDDAGTPTIFKYYIQGTNGAVTAKTSSDPWSKVVLVETRMSIKKKYETTTLQTDLATRTRMRNWQPS